MSSPDEFRIQVLGPFTVLRGGQALPAHEVANRKARTLLKVLLARRGALVGADVLAEVLWGARPPADPEANLATLVSRLRSVLGAGTITGDRHGWRFTAGPGVEVDLEEAERLAGEAEGRLAAGEPALAGAAAERALGLLGRGPLLADEPDADWAAEARREVEALAGRVRRIAWQAALAGGDPAGALVHAGAAVAADPLDEAAHRAVMLAHWRAAEPAAALAAYERLRERLADELGADPGPETSALHLAILRGEDPAAEPAASAATTAGAAPRRDTRRPAERAGARLAEAAFVGRQAELAALTSAWTAAVSHHPGMVLVSGEAGIGKTRLAQELASLAEATGGLVVTARCHQAERSLFLQPLAEAVRSLVLRLPAGRVEAAAGDHAGALAELVAEVRQLLTLPAYERGPAELERRRSFEAVTAFLRGLAREQSVLLLLDDLHQAGSSSLELLHFLAGRTGRGQAARHRHGGDRLLVVATVRAEEGGEVAATLGDVADSLELGPLAAPAVAELASQFGVVELAGPVLERTRGHTLFAVEALRAAAESTAARDGGGVPGSLTEAVLARVRRGGPEVEMLLRAAVVVGSSFDLEVVADLLGISVEDAAARAERALASRLLVESGPAYEFANDLIHQVLYETTPRPTLVARHRRLAGMLAGRPEAVAGHAAAAGDWVGAAQAWRQAAMRAAAAFANRDAERLLGEAVAAAANSGEVALQARARLDRGQAREALGEYQEAFADHTEALRLAREAGDDPLATEAVERLGWTAYFARDSQRGWEPAGRWRELAERAAAAPGARPSALLLVGRVRHAEGELEGAEAAFAAVLAAETDPATRAVAHQSLGLLLDHSDRFAEARRLLDQAVEEGRRAGVLRSMLTAQFGSALACANLGDFAGALARLERLARPLAEVEDATYHARAATAASWVWRELGDLPRARDLALRATELAGGSDAGSHPALHAWLGLAECALVGGDEAEAGRLLQQAAGMLDLPLGYHWRARLRHAELAARLVPDEAEGLLATARVAGSAKYEALALARLGRHQEAARVAAPVGSDYLLAEVAGGAAAGAALDRLAAALPADLRAGFLARGRLASGR
ncbi:MAG TPA: AAA family ATPase [Actinomycetota bacterium]|nr:AAA family ATPase [Actinomycetota bacterium]